jgi:hypothetical protein
MMEACGGASDEGGAGMEIQWRETELTTASSWDTIFFRRRRQLLLVGRRAGHGSRR